MIKNKIIYLLIIACLILFYIMFVDSIALLILILAVLFPLFLLIALTSASKHTTVSLQTESSTCIRNQESRINITISNSSPFPVSCAMITIKIKNCMTGETQDLTTMFPVSSRNQQSIKFSVTYKHCGKIIISLKQIKIYDYVKLFSRINSIDLKKEILVIPAVLPISPQIITQTVSVSDDSEYSKTKPGDDSSEIFDIRKYAYGDKINRIHWNLSSKMDETMVKEYSLPVSCQLIIVFDYPVILSQENAYNRIDAVVDSLMSLSVYMTANGLRHKIYWFNSVAGAERINDISSEDDLHEFLHELFSAGTYSDEFRTFISYQNETVHSDMSHTIYLSTVFSDEILHNFSLIRNSYRKTYITVSDTDQIKESKSVSPEDDLSVIYVPCDNITENLTKIII